MGLTVCTPTSITVTGTGSSATINSNGSVTFAAAASLLLNGVFSATYENYMVSLRLVTDAGGTSDQLMYLELASGGTANTNANSYDSQYLDAEATVLGALRFEANSGVFGRSSVANRSGTTAYIFGPFLSEFTVWRGVSMKGVSGAGLFDAAGIHQVASSYDGIVIVPDVSPITGLVTVYGFNQ